MKERVIQMLRHYWKEVGEEAPASHGIYELIRDLDIHIQGEATGARYGSRWWNLVERVYPLTDELYLRFCWAESTGDKTPEDLGWEFDESTAEIVKQIEKKKIIYEYEVVK